MDKFLIWVNEGFRVQNERPAPFGAGFVQNTNDLLRIKPKEDDDTVLSLEEPQSLMRKSKDLILIFFQCPRNGMRIEIEGNEATFWRQLMQQLNLLGDNFFFRHLDPNNVVGHDT